MIQGWRLVTAALLGLSIKWSIIAIHIIVCHTYKDRLTVHTTAQKTNDIPEVVITVKLIVFVSCANLPLRISNVSFLHYYKFSLNPQSYVVLVAAGAWRVNIVALKSPTIISSPLFSNIIFVVSNCQRPQMVCLPLQLLVASKMQS